MMGIGRNAPCWCGSGKKYKTCHMERAKQEKINLWDAVATNKKKFRVKMCFAKDVGLGTCEGKIIKSHTISRSANLDKIAKDGKVICYAHNLSELKKNRESLLPKEIGIGVASTFSGFCSKHDFQLFSCIETEPFVGRPEQCLAIAYRTLSRELYGKIAAGHLRETLQDADKGKPLLTQFLFQELINNIYQANDLANKELRATYEKLIQALGKCRSNVLRSIVIEFDGTLPFMVAGAWSPLTDLFGNQLQKGFEDKNLEQIFISSFWGQDCSKICISWVDRPDAPGKVIADQICMLPQRQQVTACLQLSVKHVENIFYDPTWFRSLPKDQLNQLNILAASGIDIDGSVPTEQINLKFDFALVGTTRISSSVGDDKES